MDKVGLTFMGLNKYCSSNFQKVGNNSEIFRHTSHFPRRHHKETAKVGSCEKNALLVQTTLTTNTKLHYLIGT